MAKTRNKVFEALEVVPANPRWAWCAQSEFLAVFTLWEDERKDGDIWHLYENDGYLNDQLGAKDLKKVLRNAIAKKIPARGIICYAADVTASPRSIKRIDDHELVKLKIYENSKGIFVKKKGVINCLTQISSIKKEKKRKNGIRDLDFIPVGNHSPDRALSIGFQVQRDQKVRNHVIKQAYGKCEYCGNGSFEMEGGLNYLEAHHIIGLAKKGKDTVDNVIALCPNHHREAHFGINAEELERVFAQKVKERNSLKNAHSFT
ncbi:HNH endonuclease [Litoribacter alkaliphilus]|uniref:HNH endonuclease n=1 Tax=Litoribacter ruber TaxID=702568 RepID=A0AAP2CLD1_9BACT|nr:HNH endonuclease signature motif containing protein [Litoribacter alkaliphilus]MBS9525854.1 HNH endonuclease [Litoribacter alkaliphilus]